MARTRRKAKMDLERQCKREQQEGAGFIIQKLRNREALRFSSCNSTRPPIWRFQASSSQNHALLRDPFREFLLDFPTTTISARQLCAFLWQILPHQTAPLRRRRSSRSRHYNFFKQPSSTSSLRREITSSFAQHHNSIEPNCCATQLVPSYDLSNLAEAEHCNSKVTPTSSLGFKDRIRESSCNHKSSRELLKVLNRIQSIREQYASNISVVKSLKVELDLSRAQIRELKREKQMKILMKQMSEDNFARKNNAHDRLKVAIRSADEELENERRSKRHSEILHWRLSQELSEVKSLFYGSLRELEKERNARILLESLCDEFAIRIRDYQRESSFPKSKSEKNDRLILDISEAWLDERMQMKKADKAGDDLVEIINSVVDRLGFDIEAFLREKRSVNLRKYGSSSPKEIRETHSCQYNSLDSFPLKESISETVNIHEDDTTNAENFGAASGEEKRGSKISRRKQVQSKESKASDKTALINEIEVSTVYEESNRPLIRRLDSSHRNSENICRGDYSCVHSAVGSNVSFVKQCKSKGEINTKVPARKK